MANEYYKILQLSEVFLNKYDYKQIVIEDYKSFANSESWFFNQTNQNYQVIRISLNSPEQYDFDANRINIYLSYFRKVFNNEDIKFLDIHIGQYLYDKENEPYDYLNIDHKYFNGVDVKNIYPEIYDCIHNVSNPELEVKKISKRTLEGIKNRIKKMPFHQKNKYFCTYIIMAICILNYLIGLLLKYKFGNTSAIFVLLGADYKTFTFGLKQFYRLFTYAFVHNDILHLFCNMFSLYNIGTYIEYRLGHTKYLLILFFSILCGGLTQGILTDNSLCIGMSAGIYGLLVVFIIDAISNGFINIRSLIPTILINICLNFMSSVAWIAHLGGAIGGFVIYYYLKDYKNIYRLILLVILLLCLIYKYVTIDTIENIYAGTDFEVLKILESLGLDRYANKLMLKLIEFYNKFGG